MQAWLAQAGATPAVLVTVAIVEGSGPREPGAKMLVDAHAIHDTIGGGHLELRAAEMARAMLAGGEGRRLERFALGPSLGQCCGGVVHLAFERVDREQIALLKARSNDDTWRLVALDGEPDSLLFDANGCPVVPANAGTHTSREQPHRDQSAGNPSPVVPGLAGRPAGTHGQLARPEREQSHHDLGMGPGVRRDDGPLAFARHRGTHVMQEQDGRRWLVDLVAAPRAQLVLFGAGHVGAAIVRALADLPCRVTWVDEREDLFPSTVPSNVTIEATDTPEAVVASAPDNATYLVMTHSHALDQRLSEAILSRPGVGWFGLIGSHTKRKQFEHRLRARGIDDGRIAAMACPVGVPGIEGKQPAVIAAAVAAQLLQVWEAQAAQESAAPVAMKLVASSERI
ncbi:xanthine dehydrogenase accessory protein XdhC [Massilia solisilvae]|uniref:Xanthine dehydrogenase accessory protein XdhC n=1 Tax=Massilia solisilvae TaxID=1811225 RepID=A0ABT2BJR9_9BURK|nr:xanthine dehydrogenase accessory protein XdhC [Massilia solisilvae]MCS0608148.1 xanthine dehydrogenase accessory protein XdhC [Massilia solisilvae]